MFHAAIGCLQAVHGAGSPRHDRVIKAFGQHVARAFRPEGDALGRAFADAHILRLRVDYGVEAGEVAGSARQTVDDAAKILRAAKKIARAKTAPG